MLHQLREAVQHENDAGSSCCELFIFAVVLLGPLLWLHLLTRFYLLHTRECIIVCACSCAPRVCFPSHPTLSLSCTRHSPCNLSPFRSGSPKSLVALYHSESPSLHHSGLNRVDLSSSSSSATSSTPFLPPPISLYPPPAAMCGVVD